MRIIGGLIAIGFLFSCQETLPPSVHAGRYYGMDSIIRIDKLFQDTVVDTSFMYLDLTDLFNGHFDASNSQGYWVREGELYNNKLNINVEPFTGKITLYGDSITLRASCETDQLIVQHYANLTR